MREGNASDQRAFAFSRELFTHADGHRDVFRAVVGKQSAAIVQRHFQRIQVELVREEVKALAQRALRTPCCWTRWFSTSRAPCLGCCPGGFDGKRRMTVDEVDDLFRRMALSAVRAALAPALALALARTVFAQLW